MRDCLIVVGMHRSGTSALAGALHRLGADFGQHLVEAQDDNVRGYYEHRRILELHEGLLADRGSSWDDPAQRDWTLEAASDSTASFREELVAILEESFAESALWAVKDPRLSHLLPLWLPVLAALEAKPRIIVASRSPAEVAGSLARRDGFSREKSGVLWLRHTLAAERSSRNLPRAFVDYADLLRRPASTLSRVGRQLDLRWPVDPTTADAELDAFLDAGLRHQRATGDDVEASWGRIDGIVPALLRAVGKAVEDPADSAPFDAIAEELAPAASSVDPLVLEHLHQFGRREVRREVWSARKALQEGLAGVSERLGGGLAQAERQLEAIASRVSSLEDELEKGSQARVAIADSLRSLEEELEQRSRAREDQRAEVDRTLTHLTQALASAETSVGHLAGEGADLRAKIARWSGEVDVERKLAALEEKTAAAEAGLAFLSSRATAVEGRTRALERQTAQRAARLLALEQTWWRRLRSRLRRIVSRP